MFADHGPDPMSSKFSKILRSFGNELLLRFDWLNLARTCYDLQLHPAG